jgi:hypothetical protein
MATYVLRPNANWNNNSLFTISGGSGSVHAALADNSDSTFITRTSNTVPAFYEGEFGTTTLSATERVLSVNLRARIVVGTAGNAQFSLGVITDRNGRTVYYSVPITKQNTLALSTVDFALNMTSAPNGAAWTQTLIDNLVFKFADNATATADKTSVYEVYVDVVTTAQPTVTVTAPTGSITNTSFPSVVWTYSDTDGDPQSAYEVKIFDSTTYGASGFSPDTSTPSVQTGIVTSSNTGQTLEADLANSTTYRAYVRVAQLANGVNYFSDWAFSQFSLAVNAPANPSVSAFFDTSSDSVAITVFGRTNVLSVNQASLETNGDGWVALTNCSIARSTAQASDGSASLSVTATAAGDAIATTTTATAFAVSASTSFSATAEFRANSTVRSTAVGIVWRNSAGTTISTTFGTAETDSASAWNQCTVTATAPLNATTALVAVKVISAGSSEIHYVDKIAFHAGTEPFWTRGGFSTFSFDIERSDDSGVTYAAIRNSPVSANTFQIATLNDYEVPLDTTVIYRSKARAEI